MRIRRGLIPPNSLSCMTASGLTALDGLLIVLYNGSNNLSYQTIDLGGFSTDEQGYFVLGDAAVTPDLVLANAFCKTDRMRSRCSLRALPSSPITRRLHCKGFWMPASTELPKRPRRTCCDYWKQDGSSRRERPWRGRYPLLAAARTAAVGNEGWTATRPIPQRPAFRSI